MPPAPSQLPHRFAVCHKADPDAHACLSNDPAEIASFMWGRGLSEYQLYVNEREYDWPRNAELFTLVGHLEFCLEMDEVLYEDV